MDIVEEKDAALETWSYHDKTWCKIDWHHEETLKDIPATESDKNVAQELLKASIGIEKSDFVTSMKIIPTSNC